MASSHSLFSHCISVIRLRVDWLLDFLNFVLLVSSGHGLTPEQARSYAYEHLQTKFYFICHYLEGGSWRKVVFFQTGGKFGAYFICVTTSRICLPRPGVVLLGCITTQYALININLVGMTRSSRKMK